MEMVVGREKGQPCLIILSASVLHSLENETVRELTGALRDIYGWRNNKHHATRSGFLVPKINSRLIKVY